ncbi:MAG: dihydrolipoamide acetyltransferase family protein [Gammaproteobacteria bacterium]
MIEFKLPSLGADMDKGTLLEWRVQPGDAVSKGQVVAVVDTTKAAVDVECWQEGNVHELLVGPGATVAVGTTLAVFREPGDTPEQLAGARARISAAAAAAAAPVAPAPAGGAPGLRPPAVAAAAERRVSPAARKRAQELGVDIDAVQGTGPHGAVSIADVERGAAAKTPAPADRARALRQTIAMAMARSKREIPHYYLAEEINLASAVEWLRRENERRPVTERLLLACLYLKAVALAARRHPALNGYFRDGEFRPSEAVHLGVAISLRGGGLIAPAIHDVDRLSLAELMRAMSDLVTRARAGSLRSSEMSDPTLTVTNLGEQSVDAVFGVIYPPQVALVGFGQVRERPAVVQGEIKPAQTVTASLSADHRASDGHDGALFLATVRELLQHPERLTP